MKGGLVVILLVFVTAILLNVIILSEGFVTAEGKDGKCVRKSGDMCTKKTVDGVEGCFDLRNIPCDPDCCDRSSELVIDTPKDGTCFRRKRDKCTKKTVYGKEGCYDTLNIACDPDCCDSSAEVITNLNSDKNDSDKDNGKYKDKSKDKDTDKDKSKSKDKDMDKDDSKSNLDSLFDTLLSTYKPKHYDDTEFTHNTSNDSSHRNQDEIDKVYDELSDEAKTSKLDKIRSILRSDIQKAVKDELLASRSTNPVDTSCPGASSPALQQGSCFRGVTTDSSAPNTTIPYSVGQQACDIDSVKPTPSVDMSQYIRKDSIPCYACTLPK